MRPDLMPLQRQQFALAAARLQRRLDQRPQMRSACGQQAIRLARLQPARALGPLGDALDRGLIAVAERVVGDHGPRLLDAPHRNIALSSARSRLAATGAVARRSSRYCSIVSVVMSPTSH